MCRKPISRTLAEQVRDAVIKYYPLDTRGLPEDQLPKLFEPGDWHETDWVLIWSEGPDNWPHMVTMGGMNEVTGEDIEGASLPSGVFAEAINNVVLGLYPRN